MNLTEAKQSVIPSPGNELTRRSMKMARQGDADEYGFLGEIGRSRSGR